MNWLLLVTLGVAAILLVATDGITGIVLWKHLLLGTKLSKSPLKTGKHAQSSRTRLQSRPWVSQRHLQTHIYLLQAPTFPSTGLCSFLGLVFNSVLLSAFAFIILCLSWRG